MLRRIIGEDIDLQIAVTDPDACVRIDRGQLDQIVLNLAVNARDAMPAGGSLTIAVRRQDSSMALSVADSGHGMDIETERRLFEPFFTTKPVGKGTGLGLSIVYGIVKQNNGDITVESEVGSGTMFTILLPEMREAAVKEHQRQAEAPAIAASETILVAEDEPTVRALVREVLSTLGYRILEAASPREAITISEEFSGTIHLLLTDVVMPEINGAELARRLSGARPDLKVLFMSGYSDSHLAARIVPEEGVAFMQKPFTVPKLIEKIREALNTQTRSS
jgi:CheY-like chemotaxis protein